jgi:hypothetical protein
MGKDSIMIERTLIIAGDVADYGVQYQSWLADVYRGERLKDGGTKN